MFRITIALSGLDRDLSRHALTVLTDALVKTDMLELRAKPRGVSTVAAFMRAPGFRFTEEPQGNRPGGAEDWQDVLTCASVRRDGSLRAGSRDLVCWRVAELRLQEIAASVEIQVKRTFGGDLFRPVVRLPNGDTEDTTPGKGWRRFGPRQRLTFVVELFNGASDRTISNETLLTLLRALTAIDEAYLRKHPEVPPLYDAWRAGRVRYMEEPPGQEDWQDIATCLRMGNIDCDDAAPWRAAELRVREGIEAEPIYKSKVRKDGGMLYHILTKRADGRIEDPSWVIGMR